MKKLYFLRFFLLACFTMAYGGGGALAQTTVTDVLTSSLFTATSTTYKDFSGVTATSTAVYAGNTSKATDKNDEIQLRTNNNNSGIVTTESGGKVRKITVKSWATATNDKRALDVYGKNSAYSSASDLYKENTCGVLIESLKKTDGDQTIEISGDYTFIGIRSQNGALYIGEISIEWELPEGTVTTVSTPTFTPASGTKFSESLNVTISSNTDGASIYYSLNDEEPTTPYDAATGINITETTTVKAIAKADGMEDSQIAEATYTKIETLNGLSALVAQIFADGNTSTGTAEEYVVNLTGAVVTGANESNAYLEEDGTAILLYKHGHGLNVGDVLSGTATVKGFVYSEQIARITSIEGATITSGGEIPLTEITLDELTADDFVKYMSRRVQVTGATVTAATANNRTTIEQNGTSLTLYCADNNLSLAEKATVTLIGYVSYYNGETQITVLDAADVAAVGGLLTPVFEFSESAATAYLGEAFTAPTLTNTSDGTATFASSHPEVAAVDEATGAVTILTVGTTIITASVAETENYTAAEAAYTLTVIDPNARPDEYVLVTSPLQLVPGESYIIASKENNMAMGWQKNETSRHSVEATFTENKINVSIATERTDETAAFEFILETDGKNWILYDPITDGYLTSNNNANGIKTNQQIGDYSQMTFTFTDAQGNLNIDFTAGSNNSLRCNKSSKIFRCYGSTSGLSKNIQLYHKAIAGKENLALTLTAEEDGVFYGTAYSDKAYVVPEGLEAAIITDAAESGTLTVDYRYTAGTTVPAETPVMLKSNVAEHTLVATTSEEQAPTNNMLYGGAKAVDANGKTYVGENYKYYLLGFSKATGKTLGFYWGTTDGAAVTYKAPYAFLAVPATVAANVKSFSFGSQTTDIQDAVQTEEDGVVYTISGILTSGKNLPKGIYIKNGKKFLVK